jgi:WD40 repeat protein/DNA-binding SARP family transcriptional activator
MEFRILGPLEVHGARGAVALGGIKPRAVLAVLLLHPNEPVSAERLALALWGEEAPSGAVRTVQVHVSRLRKALGEANILATTPVGYCLQVLPGELDAERFELLVEDGRRALAAGQVEYAATVLREALGLWRGAPLADVAYEPFAQAEIARLEEQRLAALEARMEADLSTGRHGELLDELPRLVAAHPTRERLAGQLMLALYGCGRQAEALEVYADARRALIEEVGVEPGPELQRLQEAILRHDPSLDLRHPVADLPPELDAGTAPPLVGRGDELAWLRLRWGRASEGAGGLVTLAGVSGSGKLRLAAELATTVHDRGAAVLYASGGGPADAFLTTLRRTRETTRPTLLVIHAADCTDPVEFTELEALSRGLDELPVLVLACGEDIDMLADLRSDGVLVLDALDLAAVAAIAGQYARGSAAEEVPARRLLEASGGIPRVVHEVASQWARREAARHVGVVAGRAAAEREELRSIQAELTGGVEDLQEVSERGTPRRWEAPVVCPFKGLASFEAADAQYFFGREKLVAELVARLVGAQLLGIVGPSGSGKSSVMRAGLLPALATGVLPASDTWKQVLIRPGTHPLRELTGAIAAIDDDDRAVIAVDQFEETFTTCADEAERASFTTELTRLAAERHGRYVVVIALRADFYGACAAYGAFADQLTANHVLVRSMQRDELRRAIELPARRVGLRVDPELADALVADVKDEPGALPLLSTALLELWQRRDGRRLRHTVYEQSGGVRGAVARLAEDAFAKLDAEQQVVARDVLMRLAGEGVGGGVERRRVRLSELETDRSEDVARVVALLTDRRMLTVSEGTIELAHEALLREWPRLREWIDADRDGLRIRRNLNAAASEWEELGRDDGALYRGVRLDEATEWRDARAPRLNESERAFLAASDARRARDDATRRRRIRLTGAAGATLAAAAVAIVVAALFANHARDVAASRDLATKSATLTATDPGLALAVALEALRRSDTQEAQNAVRQATLEDRASRIVAAHDGLIFGLAASPDGRLVATASGDPTVRIWSMRSGRRVGEIRGFGDEVKAVSFSPDGKRIASAARDGEIAVARTAGGPRRVVKRLEGGDFARSIDFVGASGNTLAIGTDGGRVALVRLSDGAVRELNPHPGDSIYAVDADRDAQRVLSAGADGVARIWNVAGGDPLKLPHGGVVQAASFSPDGRRVATVGDSGVLRLWDAGSGRGSKPIKISDQVLVSMRFSGNGRRIAIGALDGTIHVLVVRSRAVLAQLKGHQGFAHLDFVPPRDLLVSVGEEDGTLRTWIPSPTKVSSRAGRIPRFRRDGGLVVSGDDHGPVHLWNPQTGEERELTGQTDVSYPQFSPDGTQIVSASHDGSVRLWDVRTGRSRDVPVLAGTGATFGAAIDASGQRIAICGDTPIVVIQAPDGSHRLRLRGHRGRVNALVFSPDSKHLLTGSDDGTARVWNARTGKLERILRGHDGIVRGVSYSHDGRSIATTGNDGTVRIWPASGGDAVILVGHEGGVNTAQFNDSDDRIASAGDDGTIRIWDTAGGDALVVLYRHEGVASGADFGDDGNVVSAGADGMRITACEVCGTFDEALRVARTRAQHKLTPAERQRLLPGG